MKKIYVILLLGLLMLTLTGVLPARSQDLAEEPVTKPPVDRASVESNLEQRLSALDLGQINAYVLRLNEDIQGYLPTIDLKKNLLDLLHGKVDWNAAHIFTGLLKYLFREIVSNSLLLGKLLVLAVICALLRNLQSSFERATTGQIAYSVSYLVLITLAIGSFTLAINEARHAVENMVSFMQALLPVLLTLLTAVGSFGSALLFHPVVLVAMGVFSALLKDVILPLVLLATVLGIVNGLSERFQVAGLAGLLNQSGLVLLGLFSTVFLGILAIYGSVGGVSDGVALRTAKFATDTLVPVVGSMFSDALETMVGTSILLKNAVGVFGAGIVFLLWVLPALKILALVFVYKLAGALVEPLGEIQMGKTLSMLGKSLTMVFATVATAGLLFFFIITTIIGVGNLTTMLR